MKKIKNIFPIIILCLLGTVSTYAQESNVTRFGVKGGANFSNFRVDGLEDNNIKAGLNLGLFMKLPVSEAVAIQPEILYSSKGSKLAYDNMIQGEGEYRFNLNYLELPVMGVFHLGDVFNIQIGPYISYLASANIKNMDDDFDIQDIADLDEGDFNRVDYGLAAGVGFDFNGFIIGARYTHGFNEIGDSGSIAGEFTKNSKNSVGTVFIGFGF